jgi:hypothetical protein
MGCGGESPADKGQLERNSFLGVIDGRHLIALPDPSRGGGDQAG